MPEEPTQPNNPPVGYVVGGTLKDSLSVRLTVPPQEVQEGSFVVIESDPLQFYGLVTDLQLGAIDPRYAELLSDERLAKRVSRLLASHTLYTNLEVLPALMLERGPELDSPDYETWTRAHQGENAPRPQPIKTVPVHRAVARLASAGDVAEILLGAGGWLERVAPGTAVAAFLNQADTPARLAAARALAAALRARDGEGRLERIVLGDVRSSVFEVAG